MESARKNGLAGITCVSLTAGDHRDMALNNQKKSRRWVIVVVALVVAGTAGGGWLYWRSQSKTGEVPKYVEAKVDRRDLKIVVQATGTVQPENRLAIKAPINGRIESIRVQEGVRVKRGQILALMSSTERAALLDAARAKGTEEVKHWEEMYRPTPIIAPMQGVLIGRNVEPGQTMTAQDSIFVISDRLLVVAQVDETDMARVQLKQGVNITLDAYATHKLSGVVHQIAFEAKTVNNVTMYDVQITPEAIPDFMRSGMTASVEFAVASRLQALVVPAGAVRYEQSRPFVMVPGPSTDKKIIDAVRKDIKLGISDGKSVEILEGLAEGDTVLQENFQLGNGSPGGANPFSPFGGGRRPGQSGGGNRSSAPRAHP